jgi:hypothetical protein
VNKENSRNIDLIGEHKEQQNIGFLGEYRKQQKYTYLAKNIENSRNIN